MVDFDPPSPNVADISSISGCVGLRACLDALQSRTFSCCCGCHLVHPKSHITLGSGLILHGERLATNPLDHGSTNIHLNRMLELI